MRRHLWTAVFLFLAHAWSLAAAEAPALRQLPPPNQTGGQPLMATLKDRRTIREFRSEALSDQHLSDLLWAAFGINRPENDHRTAPSAKNAQEVDLYVALEEGLFLYEAKPYRLRRISDQDVRGLTSGQDFVKTAPVALIYVADLTRFPDTSPEAARLYAAFDAGCICQNVYLYCASTGLGGVVHDLNREPLAKAMGLGEGQFIVMAHAVGWPK